MNLATRELCGRCGADLDTGGQPPRPLPLTSAPRAVEDTGTDVGRRPLRTLATVLVAVVVVAALLVGALTLVGLGPFAPGPDVPPVVFEAGQYPGDARQLGLSDIATRTVANDDGHPPTAMVDGDAATAWRSDGSTTYATNGDPNETIDLILAEPAWISRFVLRTGDQADAESFASAARPRRIRLTFDGGEVALVGLLDVRLQAQEVVLPEPVLTTVVRIDVIEVFDGMTDEIAIAEVEVQGWSAVGGDVVRAQARAEAEPATGPSSVTTTVGGLSLP